MAVELATAYIALVPSLKGASQKISEQLSPAAAEAGGKAGEGLGRGLVGMAAKWAAPLAAAVGFGAILKTGFDEAKDAAAGTAQLAAGITSTGNAAHVSVDGLNNLASSIQDYSGQTDDSIVKSEQLLLTFTNIKNNGPDKIFDQATVASANMAAKMGGDASQQAILLGKALNDPVKGISALQRVGVSFTDSQKNTIAALVKTGDVAGAQKVILGELNKEFGGAAKAAGQSFPGELQRLHRAFEDLSQGIVQGFLPVLGPPIEGAIKLMKLITPAIGGAAAAVSGEAGKIGGALGAVFTLLKTGNFTGGIRKALGVEEDSKVVDVILNIRDGFIKAFGAIKSAVSGIDFKAIFGGLASTFGPLIPQIISLATAFSPFQIVLKGVAPLLPQLAAVFGQLATVVGSTLKTALVTMVPLFVQLSGVISHALTGVLAAELPAVVQIVTMLGKTLSQLLPVVMPIVAVILRLATTLISQLVPIITQLVTAILPPVVQIFGLILTVIAPLVTMIAGLLIPIIRALMPVVVTVFSVISSVIQAAMQIVLGVIQVVTGIITGNWSQVWTGIQNVFSGIWNTIKAVVTGALAIVGSVISSGLGLIAGVWNSIWGGISSFFSGLWSGLVSNASAGLGQIVGFFSGLGGRILGALGDLNTILWNAGANAIQGLINGIGSMIGNVAGAISNIVGTITDHLPHSPAKKGPLSGRGYTSVSGAKLVADFASAIAGGDGLVGDAMTRVTGRAVPKIPNFRAAQVGMSASLAGGGGMGAVHVFIGNEQLDSRMYRVANTAIGTADRDSLRRRVG